MEDKLAIKHLCLNISSNNPSIEEVKQELEKISNRGRSDWGELSPLVSAVAEQRKDLIKLMVEDLGFDINSTCASYLALKKAIESSDEDMIMFLVVEMKAKVNNCRLSCSSPLIFAIERNNLQMVKLLVEELGADVNFEVSKNEDGSSPFLALNWAILEIFWR
jgi:ankyrin repeat protein